MMYTITPNNQIADDTIKRLLEIESSKRDVFLFDKSQTPIVNKPPKSKIQYNITPISTGIVVCQASIESLNGTLSQILLKYSITPENILIKFDFILNLFASALVCFYFHISTFCGKRPRIQSIGCYLWLE